MTMRVVLSAGPSLPGLDRGSTTFTMMSIEREDKSKYQ